MKRWISLNHTRIVLPLLVTLMVLAFLAPLIVIFIPAGHGGVLWRRFGGGTVYGSAYGEGVHFIAPWDHFTMYDLRLQFWDNRMEALTADGLSVYVDAAIRFRLSPNNLAYLHQAVGPDYVSKVVKPQVGAVVRALLANYPTQSLLGSARNEIQDNIYRDLTTRTRLNAMGVIDPATGADEGQVSLGASIPDASSAAVRGMVNTATNTLNRPLILLQDLLISRIVIPSALNTAIEDKLVQSQLAQSYQYRLAAERFEADRKTIEAEGIKHFQNVITPGLTSAYLSFRGIQATEALAKSPNAKVVIIGNSRGLPLILNTGDNVGPAATPPTARTEMNPAMPVPAEATPEGGGTKP